MSNRNEKKYLLIADAGSLFAFRSIEFPFSSFKTRTKRERDEDDEDADEEEKEEERTTHTIVVHSALSLLYFNCLYVRRNE